MKRLIVIIMCLISIGAKGQWTDVKDSAYYAHLAKLQKDSIVKAESAAVKNKRNEELRERDKKVEEFEKENDRENAVFEKKMEKKYGKANVEKAIKGQVWIGITDELCSYGLTEPNSKKITYTKSGKTEVWIYQGQASGCIGDGCPDLDYIITFANHKAIAITTGD